jgi:hypothetical protein
MLKRTPRQIGYALSKYGVEIKRLQPDGGGAWQRSSWELAAGNTQSSRWRDSSQSNHKPQH